MDEKKTKQPNFRFKLKSECFSLLTHCESFYFVIYNLSPGRSGLPYVCPLPLLLQLSSGQWIKPL